MGQAAGIPRGTTDQISPSQDTLRDGEDGDRPRRAKSWDRPAHRYPAKNISESEWSQTRNQPSQLGCWAGSGAVDPPGRAPQAPEAPEGRGPSQAESQPRPPKGLMRRSLPPHMSAEQGLSRQCLDSSHTSRGTRRTTRPATLARQPAPWHSAGEVSNAGADAGGWAPTCATDAGWSTSWSVKTTSAPDASKTRSS